MVTGMRTISAIGNFDGVHVGHQQLLARVGDFARAHDARPGAVVFDPHPRRYFRPDDPPFLITTAEDRNVLLKAAGAAVVASLTFDAALASLTPQAFVDDVLKGALGLAGVAVGSEFRFGAGRAGDAQTLKALCAANAMETLIIEPERTPGPERKIGSSAIREAIAAGEMTRAAAMLGRRWSVAGVVGEGARLGRTIGFATANLSLGEVIEPRRGVYAVRVEVDGATHAGVANFGRKPTVGSDAALLEAHLFDFDGDLYGRPIRVEFIDFIRDEKKFDGLDALKTQIGRDSETARSIISQL